MGIKWAVYVITTTALMFSINLSIHSNVVAKVVTNKMFDNLKSFQALPKTVDSIAVPELQNPQWLQAQLTAETVTGRQQTHYEVVTYSVITRGNITSDLAEFKSQANATLNSPQGWSRLGISFQEVNSGGNFILVLSEASQVPSFSSGCGAEYSCRVGSYVIINQDRWLWATTLWNNVGGSLRDYRHMVINHEVGHWLGHDHLYCNGAGQLAPIMQQQSMGLQGCNPNAWPLDNELWSTQLGIL